MRRNRNLPRRVSPAMCLALTGPALLWGGSVLAQVTAASMTEFRLAQAQLCSPEPAAELNRKAYAAMSRNDLPAAAQAFAQLAAKYPKSTCAQDALYWQAFMLYRIGKPKELRQARTLLEEQRTRYPEAYARSDARSLTQRIAGALAQQGDNSAMRATIESAGGKPTCDKEEMAVRIEALNALLQYDLASAQPIVERLLARRDECSRSLRKQIVLLLGGQQSEEAAKLLAQVVRAEKDSEIRNDAILFLTRMPNENTALLSRVLKESKDQTVQQLALRALAAHKSPEGFQVMRSVLREEKLPDELREYTIQQFLFDDTSEEQAAFLREMYPRVKNETLKTAMLSAVSAIVSPHNQDWLLDLVRDPKESMERRRSALQSATQLQELKLGEFVKLYDKVSERELRHSLIGFYASREEGAATDKLMAIARSETDPQLLRSAIGALTNKGDPRAQQLLMQILERK